MSTINGHYAETLSPQQDEGWSASLVLTTAENRNLQTLPVFRLRQGNAGVIQRGIDDRLPAPIDTTVRKFVAMWLTPQLRTVKAQWRPVTNEARVLATSFLSQSVSHLPAVSQGYLSTEIASLPNEAPQMVRPPTTTTPFGKPAQTQPTLGLHQFGNAKQNQLHPNNTKHWAA